MKTESGPLKYRLARKKLYRQVTLSTAEFIGYEYILQGWFETREWEPGVGGGFRNAAVNGEWRDLETVDLE
jgi:hypothetical protein